MTASAAYTAEFGDAIAMLLKDQQHALHIKRWARHKSMSLCWQAITEQIEKMFKDLFPATSKTLWEEGKEQQKHQLNPEPPKRKGITMQFKRKSGKVNNPPRMEVLPRLALLLPQSAARKKTELKKVTARLKKDGQIRRRAEEAARL